MFTQVALPQISTFDEYKKTVKKAALSSSHPHQGRSNGPGLSSNGRPSSITASGSGSDAGAPAKSHGDGVNTDAATSEGHHALEHFVKQMLSPHAKQNAITKEQWAKIKEK